eukprot:6197108-Pleurochrysis_carterae.AAC.2
MLRQAKHQILSCTKASFLRVPSSACNQSPEDVKQVTTVKEAEVLEPGQVCGYGYTGADHTCIREGLEMKFEGAAGGVLTGAVTRHSATSSNGGFSSSL